MRTPSKVILKIQNFTSMRPSVRNRLKLTLINSRIMIAFRPLSMKRTGTLVSLITAASTTVAMTYPHILSTTNKEAMNTIVPKSFVLGSSL